MIVAIDTSPLILGPRSGVARALAALLAGFEALGDAPAPACLAPRRGESPRRFRRRLPGLVEQAGAEVFLSPWSAFPRLDVPVVVIVHELPFVRHGPLEGRLRVARHRHWLQRNVRECAAVVVPSTATRADLLSLHPDVSARLHVIPNGFDPGLWLAGEALPENPPYALVVGLGGRTGARKKGLDVLLEAWRRAALPGWQLRLVGQSARAIPPDVDVRADVADEELRELMAGASLLVYPSRSEGFGYPPLEAMAAGVPVLTTDAGSIPETVGEAALVVPAADVEALRAGLTRLAGDETLRQGLALRGRARARDFPVEQTARAFQRLFESIGVRA